MRRAIPVVTGAMLLPIGVGLASQGAGMIGGSSLMGNNPTFIYLGGSVVVVGIAQVALGATPNTKVQSPTVTQMSRGH